MLLRVAALKALPVRIAGASYKREWKRGLSPLTDAFCVCERFFGCHLPFLLRNGESIFLREVNKLSRLSDFLGAYQKNDPAARSKLEVFLLYPGVHAIIYHRIAHFFYRHRLRFIARCVSQWSRFWTGIEIHPGAKIGRRLVIDHGMGIVVGETAEIGNDCLLYQGVTLGGSGKERGKRHPTLGNGVMVGAGAKVLGSFTIGDYTRIASNAVVLEAVPPHATAVGVPAHIAKVNGRSTEPEPENDLTLDHVHIPDPVQQELKRLSEKLIELEERVK